MGCLAALSRFISRLGEKSLPLYRLLRKTERFLWTPEAQEALDRLKASLTHAPFLTPPIDGEPLYLYVAATTQVVSAVIVVERQEEGQALPMLALLKYLFYYSIRSCFGKFFGMIHVLTRHLAPELDHF